MQHFSILKFQFGFHKFNLLLSQNLSFWQYFALFISHFKQTTWFALSEIHFHIDVFSSLQVHGSARALCFAPPPPSCLPLCTHVRVPILCAHICFPSLWFGLALSAAIFGRRIHRVIILASKEVIKTQHRLKWWLVSVT